MNDTNRSSLAVLFHVLLGFVLATGTARAGVVIVPENTTQSNGGNVMPFGISAGNTARYQQVYAASAFPGFGGVAHPITHIIFRPDATASPFAGSIANIRIDLSTTTSSPDALNPTFSSNVGADNVTTYSGSLFVSTSATDKGGPNQGKLFDIDIPLTTPFPYDPTKGNLLLDVRNFSGGQTNAFDSQGVAGDVISRLYSTNVNGAIGSADTVGLYTEFVVEGAPEPSIVAALGLPFLALLRGHRRRS